MAIKVNGTTVINDSRALTNVASIDTTTKNAIESAGIGGAGTTQAWVSYENIGSVFIYASGNVSSIADLGTGHSGINFSSSFSDTNYSAGTTGKRSVGVPRPFCISFSETAPTTSRLSLYGHSTAAETIEDSGRITVNVTR